MLVLLEARWEKQPSRAFPPQALVGEGSGREDLGAPRVGA
jgi:hypothetical protein